MVFTGWRVEELPANEIEKDQLAKWKEKAETEDS